MWTGWQPVRILDFMWSLRQSLVASMLQRSVWMTKSHGKRILRLLMLEMPLQRRCDGQIAEVVVFPWRAFRHIELVRCGERDGLPHACHLQTCGHTLRVSSTWLFQCGKEVGTASRKRRE